jgi:hypothetical protein
VPAAIPVREAVARDWRFGAAYLIAYEFANK